MRKTRGKASKSEKPPTHPLFLRLLKGHDRPLLDAVFSPDGKHIATACEGNAVKLHRVAAGTKPEEPDVPPAGIDLGAETASVLAFSPDGGNILAACQGRQRIRYIRVEDPPKPRKGGGVVPVATLKEGSGSVPVPHTAQLGEVCAAPLGGSDGRWVFLTVVSDGKDMDLHLFSGDSRSKLKKWSVNSGGNNGAALSGDGSYAAVATWRTEVPLRALVRSSPTGPVQHLKDAMVLSGGHHGTVNAVTFGPPGPVVGAQPLKPVRAYTGSDDGTWAEWDIGVKWTSGESPKLLGRYRPAGSDRRPVRHLATSADGRVLACVRQGVPRSKRLQEQLSKGAAEAQAGGSGTRASGGSPGDWPAVLELCGLVGDQAFHAGGGAGASSSSGRGAATGGAAGVSADDECEHTSSVQIPLDGLGVVRRLRVSPTGHHVSLVFVGSGMAKIYKVPKEVRRHAHS